MVNKSQFLRVSIHLSQKEALSELVIRVRKRVVYISHCSACYRMSTGTHASSSVTVGSRVRLNISFNPSDEHVQIYLYRCAAGYLVCHTNFLPCNLALNLTQHTVEKRKRLDVGY